MFLAFAYECYYPTGASGDFIAAFDSFEEAASAAWEKGYQIAEVYDVAAREWTYIEAKPLPANQN